MQLSQLIEWVSALKSMNIDNIGKSDWLESNLAQIVNEFPLWVRSGIETKHFGNCCRCWQLDNLLCCQSIFKSSSSAFHFPLPLCRSCPFPVTSPRQFPSAFMQLIKATAAGCWCWCCCCRLCCCCCRCCCYCAVAVATYLFMFAVALSALSTLLPAPSSISTFDCTALNWFSTCCLKRRLRLWLHLRFALFCLAQLLISSCHHRLVMLLPVLLLL